MAHYPVFLNGLLTRLKCFFKYEERADYPNNALQQQDIPRLVEEAYLSILGRVADDEGKQNYIAALESGSINTEQLLRSMRESEECRQRFGWYDYYKDKELNSYLTGAVKEFSEALLKAKNSEKDQFEEFWQALFNRGDQLVAGQREYIQVHKSRFKELFNCVGWLLEDQTQPRILEFGTTEFTSFYRRLFPSITLDCSDRPVAPNHNGFNEPVCRNISGCDEYVAIDLEQPDNLLQITNRYDLIVFTEVLEHLVVNPIELLTNLIQLLKKEGFIYMSTPNFFCRKHLELINMRENPQAIFPFTGGNWDAHYHHREYGLKEILRFISEAGGQTLGFYFSDCWAPENEQIIKENADEGENLVVVIGPKNS